jgi:putative ABC transport system substrate-binding protein
MDAKRLDLLRQALPHARQIAVLIHDDKAFEPQLPPVREAARSARLELVVFHTRNYERGYGEAFAAIARSGAAAMLVMSSPDFARDRKLLIEEAARWRIPAIFPEGSGEGALMSYTASNEVLDRLVATYVDRILKGAKAGDLPIEQPTQFQYTINLKTAKTLGIAIPQATLMRADVIVE